MVYSRTRRVRDLIRVVGMVLLVGALALAGPVAAGAAEAYDANSGADNDVLAPKLIVLTDVKGLQESYVFAGKPVEPDFKVEVGGVTLKKDVDYTVKFENNNAIGTGSLTITGKGHYTGVLVIPFPIVRAYTVTFESNGGSEVDPQHVAQGETVSKPADPKRDGFKFAGWYSDEALTKEYDFSSKVTGDLTLYAKWAIPMYRVYNRYSGEHLFTPGASERDRLVGLGWSDEGVGWYAPERSSTKVYRLYNPYSGDHLYTTSVDERDQRVRDGWRQDEVTFYSEGAGGGVPLYRMYNSYVQVGTHHYTTDASERDQMVRDGWRYEPKSTLYGVRVD